MIVNGVFEITPIQDDRPALDPISAVEARQAEVLTTWLEQLRQEDPQLAGLITRALKVADWQSDHHEANAE